MILTVAVSVACLEFGLYAGKRRAVGLGWYAIACELAKGIWDCAAKVCGVILWPFRKGKKPEAEEASDKNEV